MANSINLHDVSKVTICRDSGDRWTTLEIELDEYGYDAKGDYSKIKTKFDIVMHHAGRLKIKLGSRS